MRTNSRLLPPEVIALLPKWRKTANVDDPEANVKLFLPGTRWTWYVVEFDGEDSIFGLVVGDFVEAGYFSLAELESIRTPFFGTPVERDLHFKPMPLSKLRALHEDEED